MISFENVNYEELKHMDLDVAKEIVEQFDGTWLEDTECSLNNEVYIVRPLDDSDWDDEGKYQYKEEYGVLCRVNKNRDVVEEYDVCVVNDLVRSGSYFSDYYYENSFRAEQIIKKVIPEVVIPEHTIITLEGYEEG